MTRRIMFLTGLAALIVTSLAWGQMPIQTNRTHRASEVFLTVTNWGTYGSMRSMAGLIDPETGLPAPSAEFPGNSGIEYLFQGAIWIGAIVEGETLVTTGTDGWYSYNEMFPVQDSLNPESRIRELSNEPSSPNYDPAAVSNQEFWAVCNDTLTGPWFVGAEHRPLQVKLFQKSLSWHDTGVNRFVIFEYWLSNIGTSVLDQMYVGIYYDGDVAHVSRASDGAQDDVTGFVQSFVDTASGGHDTVQVKLAWIADNDGDPIGGEFGPYSCPGVNSLKVLKSSSPDNRYSYNWWVSNIDTVLDWGPQLRSRHTDWDGTPLGDNRKYQVMSNGEFDYDQTDIGFYLTDTLWIAPPPNWRDLANGYDTRYLLSFGPYSLAPGDSVQIVFAMVYGSSFHTSSHEDSVVVDPANFDFYDLAHNGALLQDFYATGYRVIPLVAPTGLRVIATPENRAVLLWDRAIRGDFRGYNIYRATSPTGFGTVPLNSTPLTDPTFVDTGLVNTVTYWWRVTMIDTLSRNSPPSRPVSAIIGTPSAPVIVAVIPAPGQLTLTWLHSPEPDIREYRIYRWREDDTMRVAPTMTITTGETTWVDTGLENGWRYFYRMKSVDNDGQISLISNQVTEIPMSFIRELLVVDETAEFGTGNIDGDLVDSFYAHILDSLGVTYDVLHLTDSTPTLTLRQLTEYQNVLWHNEDRTSPPNRLNREVVQSYLESGGNTWFVGRHFLQNWIRWSGWIGVYYPGNYDTLVSMDLHVESVNFPWWSPGALQEEFIGAFPNYSDWPTLEVDSERVFAAFGDTSLHNKLPEMGYVTPDSLGDKLYRFRSERVGSILKDSCSAYALTTPRYKVFMFDMPLYFFGEDSVLVLTKRVLARLGVTMDTLVDTSSVALPVAPRSPREDLRLTPNPARDAVWLTVSKVPAEVQAEDMFAEVFASNGSSIRRLELPEPAGNGVWRFRWDGLDRRGVSVDAGAYYYQVTAGSQRSSVQGVRLR